MGVSSILNFVTAFSLNWTRLCKKQQNCKTKKTKKSGNCGMAWQTKSFRNYSSSSETAKWTGKLTFCRCNSTCIHEINCPPQNVFWNTALFDVGSWLFFSSLGLTYVVFFGKCKVFLIKSCGGLFLWNRRLGCLNFLYL